MDKILENRIHKRQDGRWCLVYLPDAPDSKRRYIYGKTKKEVIGKVEKLEEAADSAASSREDTEKIIFKYRKRRVKQQDQQAESAITPDSDVSEKKSQWTLQAWIMFYLENYKKNELKQTTYDSYMGIWRSHILNSQLGKLKLENVNGEKLQQFYNEMSNNGYNAKTVRHMFILINMALKMAVKLRYITENANDFVSLPKRQAYEGKTLTAEEVRVIFEKAREEELYPIVVLTICTGLRKGDDDDKIRLNQRKPSKYKGLRRFGPEKNLQRINKFMKERPIFYKNLIQMKENIRFYLRCFYCITKVMILQFNSENRTELARNG